MDRDDNYGKGSTMPTTTIGLDAVFEVAKEYYEQGPGFAQENVVLRELRRRITPESLEDEQEVLRIWYSLFQNGQLCWGYNLDNPGSPWFHVTSHRPMAGN